MIISEANQAIAEGENIFSQLVYGMIDAYNSGDKKNGDKLGKEAVVVRGMTDVIRFSLSNNSDTELTDAQLNDAVRKIYEYEHALYLDLDDYIARGSDADALGAGRNLVFSSVVPQPYSYTFLVGNTGQTVFAMPFSVSQLYDADSVVLVLNDLVAVDSFSLAGETLTWSGIPLDAGWKFEIKYWK